MRALLAAAAGILLGTTGLHAAPATPATVDLLLDGASGGAVFEGIGGASGGGATSRLLIDYPQPQRDEILDFLFKPQFGASLQLLKVEIGSDGNSTEGAEPTHARTATERNFERGYEWWIIDEAKRRNPAIKVIALAWNFPAWVGAANSSATADYLVSFIEGARDRHHVVIDYIGIWNETHMDVAFIKTLHAHLAAHGLATRIVADDSVNSWEIVAAMAADPELRGAVDVIATHYPRFESSPLAREKSAQWRLPLWSSEDGPWGDEWATAGQQSPPLAQLLNRNYILGRMTSTNIWSLVTSYYDTFELPNSGLLRAKTPWSGSYEITSPLWVVAHTTQFAAPGWRYLDAASGIVEGVGSYVSLHDGPRFSVIAETLNAAAPHRFRFKLSGGLSNGTVHVWRSNATRWFEHIADLQPRAGIFEFMLEASSLYTFTNTTGQHKGGSRPPAERPFPVPYHDDFESRSALAPRFLMEANGAFEVEPCLGRSGHCLRQMSAAPPIAWTYYGAWPEDGTLGALGDPAWRNYRVGADVSLREPGYAALYGRIGRVTSDGVIDAYQVRLYDDGRWEIRAGAAKEAALATGSVAPPGSGWRHLELAFDGEQITAALDGLQLASVTDDRHALGLAGIGDGWNRASFDNLAVTPIAVGRPVIVPLPVAPATTPPGAPELLVPEVGDHLVRLKWKPALGATGYRVRIGIAENVFDKTEETGNVTTYTFRTLTNGVKYFFDVAAVNARGAGAASPSQYAVPVATRSAR